MTSPRHSAAVFCMCSFLSFVAMAQFSHLHLYHRLRATLASIDTATVSTPATAVSIAQPEYGFNLLPGSVRRLYVTVTGGKTEGVNWSVTSGAALSATTGHWVDVTAPLKGSNCIISGTGKTSYKVSSAAQFTVTAQSAENPSATASITVNVCNPAVDVEVVPFYTTLYSGQAADIQAFVWGSANRNVTWAITGEPNSGDGALTDSNNQDTVFSATMAGRYTLTATSVADGTKTNTATVYVTGNAMQYAMTPEETEPVDCSVDPALKGKVYDVGPSQPYKTITSVPWQKLARGSTVRIHNEDTTRGNPTTYHEYFQVVGANTRTQPIRVCGVPDPSGNLPVIDANQSTGVPDSYANAIENYAAVSIGGSYTSNWMGNYTGTWTGSRYLIVEGLKIQNAKSQTAAYPGSTYTNPRGVTNSRWGPGTACIRIWPSMDTVVRGIDAYNCDNGFFSDFNANNGYAVVANTLYEGNHLHDNGVYGDNHEHQFYIQGWNEVVQFNIVDKYQSGSSGSNFKSRGFPDVIRYNHFGDGAARQLDLVDNQDAWGYTSFAGLLGYSGAITYPGNLIAAAIEAHHADYVYGNTFVNATAEFGIHYFTDMGTLDDNRLGTLWFYNNSFYESKNSLWRWFLFDTGCGWGDSCVSVEWPQIQVFNNAIWANSTTAPNFYWNLIQSQFTVFRTNVINSNWGNDNFTGGDATGWAYMSMTTEFQGASNAACNTGVSNLIGASSAPFDLTTFAPNSVLVDAGQSMPASSPRLPVRFEFGPSATPRTRKHVLTVGALD